MANTLKFGNGQWATGNGTALAYNDENSNFKPLPFDFTRASSGTVVNQSGLIETVGSGLPRIDFQGNTKGALLLEPSRTNAITQSESFDNAYWTKSGASVVSGFASPDGTLNAFKLVEDSSTGGHSVFSPLILVNDAIPNSISIFVKSNGRQWILIQEGYMNIKAYFDIENGVLGSTLNVIDTKIEDYGNGWYKCTIIGASYIYATVSVVLAEGNNDIIYTGNGTSGVYIWGAQLEEGSYPTSYIPTSGSAVTRVADSCAQTPPSGVIGQTEGTVLFDYTPYDVSTSTSVDTIPLAISNNGSSGNAIFLNDYNGNLDLNVNLGGVNQAKIQFSSLADNQRFKIGIGYAVNDLVLYVNGVQIGIDTSLSLPTCNQIKLNGFTSNVHINRINVNDLKLYNTRLSNSELAALTQV